MITLQEIYEGEKERFLPRIQDADRQTVIRGAQEMLSRVLITFNDQEQEEEVRAAAERMIQSAQSASALMDVEGETKIYGLMEYGKDPSDGMRMNSPFFQKSFLFWALLLAGAFCLVIAAGALLLSANPVSRGMTARILGSSAAAALLLFAAGMQNRKRTPRRGETLHAETTVDPEKVYHRLLAVILTIDKELEKVRQEEKAKRRPVNGGELEKTDPAELELMAQLLEDAYGRRGEPQAEEMCSQLKFYLHRKGIRVVDYKRDDEAISEGREEADREWFDLIPAFFGGTIRPALVMDGILLKKGLASNG